MNLDPKPVRNYLTTHECVKLIGGLLSGLCEQASIETVKQAVQWWAENQSAWEALAKMKAYYTEHSDKDVLMTFKPSNGE